MPSHPKKVAARKRKVKKKIESKKGKGKRK